VLTEALTAIDGGRTIAESDETRQDTARMQEALDSCAKGQAVELRPDGARNAFLGGPVGLRPGVTLHVGAGVILFASRNARDYDRKPGARGIVDEAANTPIAAQFAHVTLRPGPANIQASGPGVTVSGEAGAGRPNLCTDKFVPLPKAAPGDAPETPDSTAGLRR